MGCSDKIYVVVGTRDSDFWLAGWRPTIEEANLALEVFEKDIKAFEAWKLKMMLNNSTEKYDELIENYVETKMNDPKYVEGTKYELHSCSDDFRSNA